MPRGQYDRKKSGQRKPRVAAAWDLPTTVPADGLDYLILNAKRDELAEIVVDIFDDGAKATVVAQILQRRLDRLLTPPSNVAQIGEQLRSFGPPQPNTENPEHAQTGTDPA